MKKVAFLLLGAIALVSCQQEKTAYVDNAMLMKNYNAMQSNKSKMDARKQKMQTSMQSEGQKFQKEVQEYQKNKKTMSESENTKRRQELMKEQQQLQQKAQMQQSLMKKQSEKANDSLKKVMDNKIADYAEAHGYSYVFGMNENDNIIYAKDSKNITQDVLKELNGGEGDNASNSMKSDSTATK